MKPFITKEILQKTENEARVADIFLRDPDFQFIRDYIHQSIESISTQLLTGVSPDLKSHLTDGQTRELQGQYQWITKFLRDMEKFVLLKGELDMEIAKNNVRLEGEVKNDIS